MRPASLNRLLPVLVAACLCLGVTTTHAQDWVTTGTYDGTGVAGNEISGLGFQPHVVIVTSDDGNPSYCRTASMPAGMSKSLGTSDAFVSGRIESLDADGFTLGSGSEVNGGGTTYHWTAFRADGTAMQYGWYNGSGTSGTSVGALGASPIAVLVLAEDAELAVFRTDGMDLATSSPLRGEPPTTTGIIGFGSTSFIVGDDLAVNALDQRYDFVAWFEAPGQVARSRYAGDDDDPRAIAGLGFDPEWMLIRADDDQDGVHRSTSLTGDSTLFFQDRNPTSGRILSLDADGFTVGDANETNAAGRNYHWFAVGNLSSGTDLHLGVSADPSDPNAGETVTLTATVTNVGTNGVTSVVTTGLIPEGLGFVSATPSLGSYDEISGVWTVGDMGVGDSETLVVETTVEPGRGGESLLYAVKITGMSPTDDIPGNNQHETNIDIPLVGVGLGLAASDTSATEGETVVLSLTAFNGGPDPATGVVVNYRQDPQFELQLATPSQGTYFEASGDWDVGDLAPGAGATLVMASRIAAGAAGDTLQAEATLTALDQQDATAADDSGTIDVLVAEVVPVGVDIALAVAATDTLAQVGDAVIFGISATNLGPDAASGLVVDVLQDPRLEVQLVSPGQGSYDALTGVWNVDDLAAGTAANLILATRVAGGAAGDTLLTTAALAALDQTDGQAANDTASVDVVLVGGTADLGLGLATSDPTPEVGQSLMQTVTLTNAGPDEATGIVVAVDFPAELGLTSATPSLGAWDGSASWTLDNLAGGGGATLTLVADVSPEAAGLSLTTRAVASGDQLDPTPGNDTASVGVDVSPQTGTPWLEIQPVAGARVTLRPGIASRPVFQVRIINRGAEADTIREFHLTNLTANAGGYTNFQLDNEWAPLSLLAWNTANPSLTADMNQPAQSFSGGRAGFTDLRWAFAPGDTVYVSIASAPSLKARDGAILVTGLAATGDCVANQPAVFTGSTPFTSGHEILVDGFVAAQVDLHEVPHSLLTVGSQHNLVLDVDLPPNGFLPDHLYGLNLVNRGSALAGEDIERMQVWSDNGIEGFDPGNDTLLGDLTFSGARWQLTGLHEYVPVTGQRIYVSVDIAETAHPSRSIRMGLPVLYGPGVEMDSGNDGPVNGAVENTSSQGISVTDRVIVTADWVPPGDVHPGDRNVRLLSAVLTNTYAVGQVLESLTVTNTTVGTAPATTAQLDSVLQQVVLRLDGNDDGLLGDLTADPALGSGAFSGGTASFSGLDLDLPAGGALRVFVTGDVSLTAAAEGDRPALHVADAADLQIPGATTVGTWPLDSGTEVVVDGMVADQIALGPVPVRSLAPGDTLALAFDAVVPRNGYKDDEFVGLTLVNQGTATADDLARLRLWEDGGDDVFDAGLAGGDDVFLGDMSWFQDTWSSPVLGRSVGADGLRIYASIDVAAAVTDSATVRLALPRKGLILDSQNSGPLDREVVAGGTLVLSTSPLQSTVVFDADASTVGQSGTIRMTVRNVGAEPLTGVVPALLSVDGTAGISVGAAQPATLDLAVDASAEFTWDFDATAPGDVSVTANAQGDGASQTFGSAPTPSPDHVVFDPAVRLDCHPVTSLPASVNKGQTGLTPFTLTLVNPGATTVSDVILTGLRLRLTESPGGPGIVPDDLVAAVRVSEGTNVYASLDVLPTSGDAIDLVFVEPAVITYREPVTLGVRMDLKLNTAATSFVVSLEDATFLTAADAVSGATVPVTLDGASFPVRTDEAMLAAPAGVLAVAMRTDAAHAAVPGQEGVPLAAIELTNVTGDATSSAINLSSLAFVLRDTLGATHGTPLDVLEELEVHSAYQQHYDGPCTVVADSVVLVTLTTPVVVPADATVAVELRTGLAATAAAQSVIPVLADPDLIVGVDANNGDPVPVDDAATEPGPRLDIVVAAGGATADGRGLLPGDVAVGAQDLAVLELSLFHPGNAATAAVSVDSLTLLVRDGVGRVLDPVAAFDRLRIAEGGTTRGDVVDPAAADGSLVVLTPGLALDPGTTTVLTCTADLAAEFDTGTFQLILALDGISLSDAVTGLPLPATPAAAIWPLGSGIGQVLVPAEELAVGGESRMPPLLAPGSEPYSALGLTVSNTAPPGNGSIELHGLWVDQPAPGTDDLLLGQVAEELQVLRDGLVVGSATGLPGDAAGVTVDFSPTLLVAAGESVDLEVAVLVLDDAPAGALCLRVGETGPVAGVPGAGPGGIRVVPASGQALPLVSGAGNVSKAGLADSYVNFPNPFAAGREATTFAYSLDRPGTVSLRLFTPHGEPVITVLDRESRTAGFHQSDTWNGLNGRGVTVRNGVYLAEIVVDYDDGSRERHLRKVAVVR